MVLGPILLLAAAVRVPGMANLCKSLRGAAGCRGLAAACSQVVDVQGVLLLFALWPLLRFGAVA